MEHEHLTSQLKRLLTGLADQAVKQGHDFLYDGARLYADEVADLMLPSVMCIAQDVAERVGLGSLGYRFMLGPKQAVGFPLLMEPVGEAKRFFEVAPFLTEVFDGEVMDSRLDLARLFESAARLLKPEFDLERDTNYGDLIA